MEKSSKSGDQKFTRTIRDDFHNVNFRDDFKKEYRELKGFYLDDEKKERLKNMKAIKRGFYIFIWILKSLFLKLTPLRRILALVGFLIVLSDRIVISNNNGTTSSSNNSLIGALLIIFVLLLELKDKLLAKTELEGGRKVQEALLPEINPEIPGWKVWMYSVPANEVCGDLVDYLKTDENNIGLVMADVAGKGLSAALMMSKLQATIRALDTGKESLSELAGKINKIFNRDSLPNLFASMFYIRVSPGSSELKYVNAGHMPPILIRNDQIEELEKGQAAIGLMKDMQFTENKLEFQSGDTFIIYSDGVTEAGNDVDQFFGKKRLFNTIEKYKDYPVDKLGESIRKQVEVFVDSAPQSDDLSLMILRRE